MRPRFAVALNPDEVSHDDEELKKLRKQQVQHTRTHTKTHKHARARTHPHEWAPSCTRKIDQQFGFELRRALLHFCGYPCAQKRCVCVRAYAPRARAHLFGVAIRTEGLDVLCMGVVCACAWMRWFVCAHICSFSLSLSLSLSLSVSVSLSLSRARTLTHTHTFVHAHNYYFTLPPSLALPPSLPLVFVLSCAHPHRSHTQANDQPIAAHKRKLGFIDIALSDWAGEIIFWVYVCASPQQAGQRLVSKLEDTDRRITTCLSTLFPQQTLSTRVNSF